MKSKNADPAEIDWDRIHNCIQDVLNDMAKRISERWPAITSRPGRTDGPAFPLFSYRTFETIEQPDINAIVVGIELWHKDDGIEIRGDVSGEESGVIHYNDDCLRCVEMSESVLINAADEIARKLANQIEIIPEALAVSVASD